MGQVQCQACHGWFDACQTVDRGVVVDSHDNTNGQKGDCPGSGQKPINHRDTESDNNRQ